MSSWLVVASIMLAAAIADAAPCSEPLDRRTGWVALQGELVEGATCGSFVGSTNANPVAYSLGQFAVAREISVPYRMTLHWRRLGAPRALELYLLGGALLVAEQQIGLWTDDASFASDGFRPLPGYSPRDEHEIVVEQRPGELEVSIDGKRVGRWVLHGAPVTGRPAIAFKGGRGTREQMWFRDVRVVQLEHARPK